MCSFFWIKFKIKTNGMRVCICEEQSMNNNEYDVIVVGAGCAGPAAAKKAAELGLKVLILEKSQVPGEKNVSGTCLNGAALLDSDLHYIKENAMIETPNNTGASIASLFIIYHFIYFYLSAYGFCKVYFIFLFYCYWIEESSRCWI